MSIKIRLARAGSKKRPFYRVVAADSRMPRDGRFIEKLGTYNPLLNKDDKNRVNLDLDRIKDWLSKGAQTTDRISRILENLEVSLGARSFIKNLLGEVTFDKVYLGSLKIYLESNWNAQKVVVGQRFPNFRTV